MESEEEDQWSWWQREEDSGAARRTPLLVDPAEDQGQGGSESESTSTVESGDRVRRVLIGVVAALSVALAGVSYVRFADDSPVSGAAPVATTVVPQSTTTTVELDPAPASTLATTTAAPTTVRPGTSSTETTTTPPEFEGPPSPPQDVTVVATSSTGAEIRWRSEQCVGSRYQVGDFEAGGGGFPNVDRCWFNHVVLAGEPDFSPPLSPDTSYTVTIQAVGPDGTTSEPVMIEFTTTS